MNYEFIKVGHSIGQRNGEKLAVVFELLVGYSCKIWMEMHGMHSKTLTLL